MRAQFATLGLRAARSRGPFAVPGGPVTRRRLLSPLVRRAVLEFTLGERGRRAVRATRMAVALASVSRTTNGVASQRQGGILGAPRVFITPAGILGVHTNGERIADGVRDL